jgi:hypothetical protein
MTAFDQRCLTLLAMDRSLKFLKPRILDFSWRRDRIYKTKPAGRGGGGATMVT